MGKTNCPIQGGKIEEEKECLGFRIKDEIGKQGGFKVLTGNNGRVLLFKALDSFSCVPVSELEDFAFNTPLLNRRKLLLFIKEHKQQSLSKKVVLVDKK